MNLIKLRIHKSVRSTPTDTVINVDQIEEIFPFRDDGTQVFLASGRSHKFEITPTNLIEAIRQLLTETKPSEDDQPTDTPA
jgi:hypothetical protein